jgi:serine/threonine protein kinase
MGVCATKDAMAIYGINGVEIPRVGSIKEYYVPTSEFFIRTETVSAFKAFDRTNKKPVLIKQYSMDVPLEKYLGEIAVLVKLDHPFIIKLMKFFQTETHRYLVYQHRTGVQILEHFGKSDKAIGFYEIKNLFKSILMTINYIHSNNVFHGKLDFTTIHMGEQGLAISGFGNAKDFTPGKSKKNVSLVQEPSALALTFQAPEVIDLNYGIPSDIWCCGILFYTTLTAALPFNDKDDNELKTKIKIKDINKALLAKNGAPEALINIIAQMLAKNPKDRPTAAAILKNPFFDTNVVNGGTKLLTTIQSMKEFSKKSQATQKLYLALSDHMMANSDRVALADHFNRCDENKDGVIDFEEFKKAIESAGLHYKEEEALVIFNQVDQDKSGKIEYKEFLAVFLNFQDNKLMSKLKTLFNEIDVNHDNELSKEEIHAFIGDHPQIAEALEKLTAGGKQNSVSFDQFKEFFVKEFGLAV